MLIESFNKKSCDGIITLRHLRNTGIDLVTSVTVLGERIDQCSKKGFGPADIRTLVESLPIEAVYPKQELRLVCIEVEEHLSSSGRYGSSCTDRTHLAYSIVDRCDYYATSASEKRALDCPPLQEGRVRTTPITIGEIKTALKRRGSKGSVTQGPLLFLLRKDESTCEPSTT